MSSVQDFMECPQCKGLYITEFQCRTAEETRTCFRCGRNEQWFIRCNEQGEAIMDEQEKPQLDYRCEDGCGAMRLSQTNGFAQVWVFHEPISEEIKKFFREAMKDEAISKENSYLTSWDEEKKEVVAVYGNLPPTYEEIEGEEDEQEPSEEGQNG